MTRVARLYHEEGVAAGDRRTPAPVAAQGLAPARRPRRRASCASRCALPPARTPTWSCALERALRAPGRRGRGRQRSTTTDHVTRELGDAAAYHLEPTVRSGDVIGVSSWSATLLAMVDAMHPVQRRAATCGSSRSWAAAAIRPRRAMRPTSSAGWPTCSAARATFLPAPSSVSSAEARARAARGAVRAPAPWRCSTSSRSRSSASAACSRRACWPAAATSSRPRSCDASARSGVSATSACATCAPTGDPVRSAARRAGHRHRAGAAQARAARHRRGRWPVARSLAIRAALLGGWINCLITDRATAERLLEPARRRSAGPGPDGSGRGMKGSVSPASAVGAIVVAALVVVAVLLFGFTVGLHARRRPPPRRLRSGDLRGRQSGTTSRSPSTTTRCRLADVLNRITPDARARRTTEDLTPIAEELGLITTGRGARLPGQGDRHRDGRGDRHQPRHPGLQVDGYDGPIKVRVYVGTAHPQRRIVHPGRQPGFIEFGDFKDQTEYGKVASEINKRVVDEPSGGRDVATPRGQARHGHRRLHDAHLQPAPDRREHRHARARGARGAMTVVADRHPDADCPPRPTMACPCAPSTSPRSSRARPPSTT